MSENTNNHTIVNLHTDSDSSDSYTDDEEQKLPRNILFVF